MTAKKKGAKPKKMAVKKDTLRKGALDDRDADKAAGGMVGTEFMCSAGCSISLPPTKA